MKTLAAVFVLFFFYFFPTIASAQDSTQLDRAWERYEELGDQFEEVSREIDVSDAETVTGGRLRLQGIEVGEEFVRVMQYLLREDGTLDASEREALIDGELTIRQVVSTYRVELGMFEVAFEELSELRADPRVHTRPESLLEAIDRWLGRAQQGVAQEISATVGAHVVGIAQHASVSMVPPLDPVVELSVVQPPERRRLTAPILTTVVGAGVAGAGAYFYAASVADIRSHNRLVSECFGDSCGDPRIDQLAASARRNRAIGITSLAAGSALAVGGTVWTVLRAGRGEEDNLRVSVVPVVIPRGNDRHFGAQVSVVGW